METIDVVVDSLNTVFAIKNWATDFFALLLSNLDWKPNGLQAWAEPTQHRVAIKSSLRVDRAYGGLDCTYHL